jgi:pimeloyl-ACP methyl ester carboxylesterase
MNQIADDHFAIAFDRRGHGDSDLPRNSDYSVERSADDVLAVADALNVDRFVLVGHSGGGAVAFAFAAQYPERVAGLLLVDPMPDPAALPPGLLQSKLASMEGDDYEQTVTEYYGSIAGPQAYLKERIVNEVLAAPREVVTGTLRAFMDFRPLSYSGKYRGPALAVIQSQFDSPHALHRIGGFPHTVIDGVGHWLQIGAPDEFNRQMKRFLDQVESGSQIDKRASA